MAIFQVVFMAMADFGDTAGTFTTKALTVSVAVAMTNPSVLGFPPTVSGMPFAQCFVLMIVLGTCLSSLMVLFRFRWEMRIKILTRDIDILVGKFGTAVSTFGCDTATVRKVCSDSSENQPGEGEFRRYHEMFVERQSLKEQLKRYDICIRVMVVVWYFVAFLSVAGAYDVL